VNVAEKEREIRIEARPRPRPPPLDPAEMEGPPGGGPFTSCADGRFGYQASAPVLPECSLHDELKPVGKPDVL
jgi:hypothetical protein